MFSFPQAPIPSGEEDLFISMPTPLIARQDTEFQGTKNILFYYPATQYAYDGVGSPEPKPEIAGNDFVFSSGAPAGGRGHCASNGENGNMRPFHGLDIHFQEESNHDPSVMKQVIGDDDTLSLFPDIIMDGEYSKTLILMHGIQEYNQVHHSGLAVSEESSKLQAQRDEACDRNLHLAGLLYEKNVLQPTTLPRTRIQEHGKMVWDYEERRELKGEAFNAQLRNQVCPPQQAQLGEGSLVPFMSVCTTTGGGHPVLSPFPSFLPASAEQDVLAFTPWRPLLNSGEVYISSHPARKLETLGGKKIFSSQQQEPSGSGKGVTMSNLHSSNASTEYSAQREELKLPSSLPSSFGKNPIPLNLRGEYVQGRTLSPDFTASVSPRHMQAMTGFSVSVSNYGSRTDDREELKWSHPHSLEDLRNKSTSSLIPSMHVPFGHGLNVSYPVPGSSIRGNQPISVNRNPEFTADEKESALGGYRDLLLTSYTNATNSHSTTYIGDHRPLPLLEQHGLTSSGEGLMNFTARRSPAVSIRVVEPECTTTNGFCELTNLHKEKRWIYKQARLPKKRPFTSGDRVKLIMKKRRGKYQPRATGGEPKMKTIRSVSAATPDTSKQQDGHHMASPVPGTSSSPSCAEGMPFHDCAGK